MKIALVGYGKMGQIIDHLATKKGHEVVARLNTTPSVFTLNNAEVVIKETDKDKERKTDTSIISETTNKSELKEESESNNKAAAKKASEAIVIDKKEWSPVNLLWLFIPVLIVVFLYNKYKSKIWWV